MNMPNALETRDLEIRFGAQVVLRDFSLSLAPGEKALLTGPSGCGKSTVLRCFLGFVVPMSGAVCVEGEELTPDSVWRLRRRMAHVAQEPDLGTGTTAEAIERPFHYRANASLRKNLSQAPELFERFNLARELLHKDVGALSGGEKQRIALVSSILLDRRIFLLDEITSALDKAGKQAVAGYFREREDITAMIVAHDPEVFPFIGRIVEIPCQSRERHVHE